jgi:hypothetical protein
MLDLELKDSKRRYGKVIKSELESEHPELDISEVWVLEVLWLDLSDVGLAKEIILDRRYSYPFMKMYSKWPDKVETLVTYQLCLIRTTDDRYFVLFLDLNAGPDLVRGKPITWLEEIHEGLADSLKLGDHWTFAR